MTLTQQAESRLQKVLDRYESGPLSGIFTDGGASPNPGPGGWGFVHVLNNSIIAQQYGASPETTNNRMELTALISAYQSLPADAELTMYSDSNLCVRTVNEWAKGWMARGWRRSGGEIANLELVKELYAEALKHKKVKLEWIKAHNGWRWNEYADKLASLWTLD